MAEEKLGEEFANWGGGAKTARPKSVGPHDVKADQENPADPGIDPGRAYKPGAGDQEGKAGPAAKDAGGSEREFVNIRVASEAGAPKEKGAPRDAEPLTSLADE